RDGASLDRPEGPPAAVVVADDEALRDRLRLGGLDLRAGRDPPLQHLDLRGGPLLFGGRHLTAPPPLRGPALVGLPADDRGARVAALHEQPAEAEVEPALEFLALAVALEAVRLEQRPDVSVERRRHGLGRYHTAAQREYGDECGSKSRHEWRA